jgi:hypothetical protein
MNDYNGIVQAPTGNIGFGGKVSPSFSIDTSQDVNAGWTYRINGEVLLSKVGGPTNPTRLAAGTSNGLLFTVNGSTNVMAADTSGNVGIGSSGATPTSDPFYVSKTGALHSSTLSLGSGSTVNAINFFSTASIAPSAVLPQTCSDQTFALTGVSSSSDRLYLTNSPNALGNLSATANASAANAVNIHFCNSTSTSVTPPAGVYAFVDLR